MGALNSKSTTNEITIDFRDDGSAEKKSKFTLPEFHKKHSKTRLQLLKERGRKKNTTQNDQSDVPSGILQKLRATFGNIMPRFRNRQYQKAQEDDSQHGVTV
jgi:hypothetical protein